MLRQFKRRIAIRDYVRRLPAELLRRWGEQRYYALDQVSSAAEQAGFDKTFLAYAHALFCRREEFDSYYGPLKVACTYDGLRRIVSRRYFEGASDFDAASIIRFNRPLPGSCFRENDLAPLEEYGSPHE
jgi:hypothetical protein